MSKKIVIVEDEPAIRENYLNALRRRGYDVSGVATRAQAIKLFEAKLPDLVVLDVSLENDPEGGYELCRYLRTRSTSLPIIFLTALDSELDKVSGIRLDADDYLTKDVSLEYLLARIAALFRRNQALLTPQDDNSYLQHGELELDQERLICRWKNQPVALTVTEFWILYALAKRPGQVKDREQLMQAAKAVVDDATVTSHIKRIRKKFNELDPSFDSIESVYGAGYRWQAANKR
jgi:two-component system, OmpR family, response regulator